MLYQQCCKFSCSVHQWKNFWNRQTFAKVSGGGLSEGKK